MTPATPSPLPMSARGKRCSSRAMSVFAEGGFAQEPRPIPARTSAAYLAIDDRLARAPAMAPRRAQTSVSVSEHCDAESLSGPNRLGPLIQSFSGNGDEHGPE